MNRLAEQHKENGLVVLAVNIWDESKKRVAEFAEKKNAKMPMLLSGSKVATQYRLLGVPTCLWVDPGGLVVDVQVGFYGPEPLEQKTRRLLGLGDG